MQTPALEGAMEGGRLLLDIVRPLLLIGMLNFNKVTPSFLELRQKPLIIALLSLSFVVLALRFRGDAVVGASFLRAFVARGVWVGVGCATISGLAAATIWLTGRFRRPFYRSKPVPWTPLLNVMLIGSAVGFVVNIFFTLALSFVFDDQIRARAARADNPKAIVFKFPDQSVTISLRQRADGSYEHRLPLQRVTDSEQNILEAGEDHRHKFRAIGPDFVRLIQAPFDSTGASGIGEQLAGLLFELYPRRETTVFNRLYAKIKKTLIGIRIDDIIDDRKEQTRLYLELASFGTFSGHEVVGLQAAAQIFYGVQPEDLAPEQLAELMARVKNPARLFPYRRTAETDQKFNARLATLHKRASWFLQQAENEGYLSNTERAQAEQRMFSGLRSPDQILHSVTHPRLFAVYRELRRLVPDLDLRHVEVRVGFDTRAQAAVTEATQQGLAEIAPMVHSEGVDRVVADVVVLGTDGSIRARLGMADVSDQMASQLKGETYGLARSTGVLFSMSDEVEPGITAASALADSRNPPAIALGERIGLERLEAHLQSQGFQTTGAYPFLPLGSGVSGSPTLVASVFAKFGYSHPGSIVIQPSLISEVRDIDTGDILFRPKLRAVFTSEICAEVRRALEQCALSGTARRLEPLARAGRLSAKTGSAAFLGKDGHLKGRGGSWVVANDSVSQATVAIRVRWQSGRPYSPEGGRSAVVVANHLITKLRALN